MWVRKEGKLKKEVNKIIGCVLERVEGRRKRSPKKSGDSAPQCANSTEEMKHMESGNLSVKRGKW